MSNIEWTHNNKTPDGEIMPGKTWNVTVGCTEESRGCLNCYAAKMAWRIVHMGTKASVAYSGTVKKLENDRVVWTGKVNILEERLLDPVKEKKPTTYFVDSMSDLFHKDIPFEFIDKVMAVMTLCPQHIFQVLTKRTDRMLEYFKSRQDFDYANSIGEAADIIICENYHLFHVVQKLSKEGQEATGEVYMPTNEFLPHLKAVHWAHDITYTDFGKEHKIVYEGPWPAPHIWLGTSIENQKAATDRHASLYELHRMGWMTWVSNEPFVGRINWREPYYGFLDWMVTGGESGSEADPMHPDWVYSTGKFCIKNNIPWFFKQHGSWQAIDQPWEQNDPKPLAKNERWMNIEGGHGFHGRNVWRMRKSTKGKTGRLLDGRTHDAMPALKTTTEGTNYRK